MALAVAVAPAVHLVMPAVLLVLRIAAVLLPLDRLAVPVVVVLVPVPVLHAERRRSSPVVALVALARRVAVPVEGVVVMVAAEPLAAPALLLVLVLVPVVVVVVVGVCRVVSSLASLGVLRVRAAAGFRPEHVLPAVVQRVEETILVEKPQEHRNCG